MQNYQWVLAFHLIAMVAWMAGMFYLPRLFVYHADAAKGSELSETFKIMERRLLRIIMNPAMILTFLFGGILLYLNPALLQQPYMHAKLFLVFSMAALHGFLSRCRRDFEKDANRRSARFYRILNEVPTLLLIAIVLLVILKPF